MNVATHCNAAKDLHHSALSINDYRPSQANHLFNIICCFLRQKMFNIKFCFDESEFISSIFRIALFLLLLSASLITSFPDIHYAESALWSCCLFRTAENHKINLVPFNFVFYNCNYNSIFVIVSIVPSKKLKNHQIIRP